MDRQQKIEIILKSIQKADENFDFIDKNKLIGECSKTWGTARRTTLEYLQELVARQDIVIDGNNVWTLDRWEKIQKAKKKSYLNIRNY